MKMSPKFIGGAAVLILIVAGGIYIIGRSNKPSSSTPTPSSPSVSSSASIVPDSGKEGTEVTISYLNASASLPTSATVKFYDAGEHGWHMVSGGAGIYVAYDTAKGLTYTAPATFTGSRSFSATVPQGICGYIIQPEQAPEAPPKALEVSLEGPDGQPIPGTQPTTFYLICDKYKLKVKIMAIPDKVLPDGIDASTITANLTVTGPAQVVIGQKITKPTQPIILVSPLGLVMVHFHTSLGTLAPNPANVKTDFGGNAVVTLTSTDAGIAKVQAVASGIGDALVNVYFEPKITAVKEDFVEPNSPTNYQISTIPKDASKLDIHWEIIYPKGKQCGSLTGPADGKGLTKNGYFHGPTKAFPNGCDPDKYEAFVKIKVTVTDQDGQSDTKTFPARAFEGQGFVKLP